MTQRITGIEAAQLRALAGALDKTKVDQEAAVALDLIDGGVLHVQVDHPDDRHHPDSRRTWFAIGLDSEVLHGVGPAAVDT